MLINDDPRAVLPTWRAVLVLLWVLLCAYFFANVEVQIEGAAGWAANLPTWRIHSHWLLDVFWGGRELTGYHAWLFPFMTIAFHLPVMLSLRWRWELELRVIAAIMLFWVLEDFLWFVVNPAYGWAHFAPPYVPWHHHWLLGVPVDYWIYVGVSMALAVQAHRIEQARVARHGQVSD